MRVANLNTRRIVYSLTVVALICGFLFAFQRASHASDGVRIKTQFAGDAPAHAIRWIASSWNLGRIPNHFMALNPIAERSQVSATGSTAPVLVPSNTTPVPQTPCSVRAYVPNNNRTLFVVDTSSNTVLTTIGVGFDPEGVAVNDAGTRAYVGNFESNTVSVIDTSANVVLTTVPVAIEPGFLALNPSGTRLYVTHQNIGLVSVIDTSTNTVLTTIPVGGGPDGVAVNRVAARAYVVNNFAGTLSVIDTDSNTVLTTVPVGVNPIDVAVNSAGTRAYVTNALSGDLSVIDTVSNTVLATVPLGRGGGLLALNPVGTRAYILSVDVVIVFDTTLNTVLTTITLEGETHGIAFSPEGTRAYIPITAISTISVIDTSTNTELTSIAGFSAPRAFGNFIGTVCPSPSAEVSSLITTVAESTSLPAGTKISLNAKLQDAQNALQLGDTATACSDLQDLINQVKAQSGKKIPVDLANSLIGTAQQIRNQLGCGSG